MSDYIPQEEYDACLSEGVPTCECCKGSFFSNEICMYVIVESHNEDLIGIESSFCQNCEKGAEYKDAMGTHARVTDGDASESYYES